MGTHSAIRPKLCGNCAFPENFYTKKLGEIRVYYAVYGIKMQQLLSESYWSFQNDAIEKNPWNLQINWKIRLSNAAYK